MNLTAYLIAAALLSASVTGRPAENAEEGTKIQLLEQDFVIVSPQLQQKSTDAPSAGSGSRGGLMGGLLGGNEDGAGGGGITSLGGVGDLMASLLGIIGVN